MPRKLLCIALVAVIALPAAASPRNDGAALIAAVREHRPDELRRLAANGADMNAAVGGEGNALIVAARLGDLALVDILLRLGAAPDRAVRGDGNALIAAAARPGNLAMLQRLVAAGARVDAVVEHDETPLINAARSGDVAHVAYLIGRGADVNQGVSVRLADGSAQWRTPLNQARSPAVRRYLSERGAR
ncbi:ankyrin repeat domain-containing protein [Lysobacter silvisoli]|nr:ankyrin repeat domain-containing protein [Lysobacter silvisoli]